MGTRFPSCRNPSSRSPNCGHSHQHLTDQEKSITALKGERYVSITAMDSIEKAMTGMTVQQKTRFISSITEMFLGDSYRLNRLIGGMMVYRYDILARDNAAVASSNAAATLPKPPEETGATKQATTRQLGIDFTNSDKSEWARLISFISGYDSETLRKKFDVDYDSKQTLKDMDIVCAAIRNLMPGLARKMEKDRKG